MAGGYLRHHLRYPINFVLPASPDSAGPTPLPATCGSSGRTLYEMLRKQRRMRLRRLFHQFTAGAATAAASAAVTAAATQAPAKRKLVDLAGGSAEPDARPPTKSRARSPRILGRKLFSHDEGVDREDEGGDHEGEDGDHEDEGVDHEDEDHDHDREGGDHESSSS